MAAIPSYRFVPQQLDADPGLPLVVSDFSQLLGGLDEVARQAEAGALDDVGWPMQLFGTEKLALSFASLVGEMEGAGIRLGDRHFIALTTIAGKSSGAFRLTTAEDLAEALTAQIFAAWGE